MHCKGSSRENTLSRYGPAGGKYGNRGPMHYPDEEAPPLLPPVPHPHHFGPPGPLPQLPPQPPPGPPPPPPAPPAPPPPNPECDMKNLNTMFGMTASDIDKYSRIVFPVTFTCFQLMYWIIYQFLSDDFDTEDNFIFLGETVHFKVHDPRMHCKGSSRENTLSRYGPAGGKYGIRGPMRYPDEEAPPPMPPHPHHIGPPPLGPPPQLSQLPPAPPPGPNGPNPPPPPPPPIPNPECDMKDLNKMFGMTSSDIDKYSRVIFPVTFTSFQLMYWIIYQHLSDDVVEDLVYLGESN